MKKYDIIAYAEEGLPRKETIITAKDHDEAMNKAWRLFPEYHEVGAYEIEEARDRKPW